jgi:hypothetical protein
MSDEYGVCAIYRASHYAKDVYVELPERKTILEIRVYCKFKLRNKNAFEG